MNRRMTSETVIFDTDWLTEADFEGAYVTVRIDYQAYDTLKVIVDLENIDIDIGALFQEFEVYKLKNIEVAYRDLIANGGLELSYIKSIDKLTLYLAKYQWENYIKGLGSIYIKGVKR